MKIKYIFPLLLVLFAFACKNELTIFEQINEETKLEDAIITGVVNSVVKFNSKLYASDGNLYTKNENDVRGWSKIGSPSGTIIKLAADSTNLYALNEDKVLYTSTNADSWTKVDTTSMGTIQTIFWDGANETPGAYLKTSAGKFYKLVNGSSPSQEESSIKSTVIVKNNGKTYTASNGTVSDDQSGKPVSDLGTVYSLTYSAVDSALYAGTSKGLQKLPVGSDGRLTGDKLAPPGNWGATIKEYEAFAVLATTGTDSSNPNPALYSSTIATGSAGAKVNGLWGYYYSRRDNWNRE